MRDRDCLLMRTKCFAIALVAGAAFGYGCGSPASSTTGTPTPPHAAYNPIPCPSVDFDPVGGTQNSSVTVGTGNPAPIGIHLYRGAADYIVTRLEIDVLPPGTHANGNPANRTAPTLANGRLPHVMQLLRQQLEAGDQVITLQFTGTDDRGMLLPAGRYEIGFILAAIPIPNAPCLQRGPSPGIQFEGLLTTVTWLG